MGLSLPHHLGTSQTNLGAAEHEKEVSHSVHIPAGGVYMLALQKSIVHILVLKDIALDLRIVQLSLLTCT